MMHINFGNHYRSTPVQIIRRVAERHFPRTEQDVVASASAADTRPPSPEAPGDKYCEVGSSQWKTETYTARRAGTPREGFCG
eukprot:6189311-Pleurochrysis_carterae.AAC.1